MARGFNKVMLMGNLTRDVEVRHLPSGNQSVAAFGLAVNRQFRTAEGENREEVTFVDCEAWGKTGETLSKFLKKGRPVFIEGRLKLDQWQDKEGQNRSKMKVVVEDFRFIDAREGGGGGGGGGSGEGAPARSGASRGGAGGGGGGANYEPVGEEDIPF
ncbi:MAG TPA: single-stranded DNA-binding protein [Phycisphaerales bacterium]|nr:single-stranded DNA-binding protein [Phycisphaerales bacterium]